MKLRNLLVVCLSALSAPMVASPDDRVAEYSAQIQDLRFAFSKSSCITGKAKQGTRQAQLQRECNKLLGELTLLEDQIYAMTSMPTARLVALKLSHAALVEDAQVLSREISRTRTASPSLRLPTPVKLVTLPDEQATS